MNGFRFQWRTRYVCRDGHKWSMPFGTQAFLCPVCGVVIIEPRPRLTKREIRRRAEAWRRRA